MLVKLSVTHFKLIFSIKGGSPPEENWQYLEIFLVVKGGNVLLTSNWKRLGAVLKPYSLQNSSPQQVMSQVVCHA
jgi:hypothetical protein